MNKLIYLQYSDFYKSDYRDFISIMLAFLSKEETCAYKFTIFILGIQDQVAADNIHIKILRIMGFNICSTNKSFFLEVSEKYSTYFCFNTEHYNLLCSKISNSDIRFFNFNLILENFDTKDADYQHEEAIFHNFSFVFSRKSHELSNFKNLKKFMHLEKLNYISGYMPFKPILDGVLVSPSWNWISKEDLKLSGINFVNILSKEIGFISSKKEKTYRSIYIGSSSLNKNAIFTLIFLIFSRLISWLKNIEIKPDRFIITRFYGLKGTLIWFIALAIKRLVNLFRINISIITLDKNKKISHKEILNLSEECEYGLITYLKEGFPRVAGEYIVTNTTPLIWNFLIFADGEINNKNILSIKKIFNLLTFNIKYNIPNKNDFHNMFLKESDIMSKLDNKKMLTLKLQFEHVTFARVPELFYIFLTSDVSWLKETITK